MHPLFMPHVAQSIAAALAVRKINEIINVSKVPFILWDNYSQLRQMNKTLIQHGISAVGTDDYYHKKAQYEISKLGIVPMLGGQALGFVKEVADIPKNLFIKHIPIGATAIDFAKDLTVNVMGATLTKTELHDARSDGIKQLEKALQNER